MRQTVLESLLQWEENTSAHQPGCHWKHITQWKRAHALKQTQPSFLPLSSLATQRDSPNVTSNAWLVHRGTVGYYKVSSSPFLSLSCSLTGTHLLKESDSFIWKACKKIKKTFAILDCSSFGRTHKFNLPAFSLHTTCKSKCQCVSGRLAGSVWPPVFTHKQSNLQPDQPVWVWSPVSHSPGDTLPPQTQAYSGHQEATSQPPFSSQTFFTYPWISHKHMAMMVLSVSKCVFPTYFA